MAVTQKTSNLGHDKKRNKAVKRPETIEREKKMRQRIESVSKQRAEKTAQREELKKRLVEAQTAEEKATMQEDLNRLQAGIEKDDVEMRDAEEAAEELKAQEDGLGEDDEHGKPQPNHKKSDHPLNSDKNSTKKPLDASTLAEKMQEGLRFESPPETIDITVGTEMRDTQAVVCYKNGFGKPAIVVENDIPTWPIYRIRKDILIRDSCPNLMAWRRAGKIKDAVSGRKWGVDDIAKIHGIAIDVAPEHDRPEDLVQLIPRLSFKEKDELKKAGIPLPRQPDVQLFIEWKTGLKADGESKERFTSWESRSGCRTLWKKHQIADAFLLRVARQREVNYRKDGGRHSSEERTMSPLAIPLAGSTPPPGDTPDPGRTETPEAPTNRPKSVSVKEETSGGSGLPNTNASQKPIDLRKIKSERRKQFIQEWCDDNGKDFSRLTDKEDGTVRARFDIYWETTQRPREE